MASQPAPFRALPRAAPGSGTRLSSSPSRCLPSVWCPRRVGQQCIAPGDRGAQRLLPVRQVAAAAGQQAQRMVQPGQDRLRRQQLNPRRRQLDGQRQAVESAGDRRDRRHVLVVESESRHRGGGPLGEQAHRRAGGQRGCRRAGVLLRDRERRDRAFLLAGNAKRRAAADQDPNSPGLLEQPCHDRGAVQKMLEVVQHDQEPPVPQLAHQVLHQRPVPGILQPDALGDRGWHQSRIPDGCERDEVDAVRVVAGHRRGQGDAQPGLAAAARSGQRDQVAVLQPGAGHHVGCARAHTDRPIRAALAIS